MAGVPNLGSHFERRGKNICHTFMKDGVTAKHLGKDVTHKEWYATLCVHSNRSEFGFQDSEAAKRKLMLDKMDGYLDDFVDQSKKAERSVEVTRTLAKAANREMEIIRKFEKDHNLRKAELPAKVAWKPKACKLFRN